MAEIDKIKVKKVIKEKFHDLGKDANLYDLSVAYLDDYPEDERDFTMDELMDEMMIGGAVVMKKIKKIVDDNEDVQLEQDEQ